jgi:hypothetical protein
VYNETALKQEEFLAAVRKVLTIGSACELSGVNRASVFRWMAADERFREAVHDAQEHAVDVLEGTVYRRALDKSDVLALGVLNARRPDLYRYTRRLEVSGPGGGPISYVVRWLTEAEAPPLPPAEDVPVALLEAGEDDAVLEAELLAVEDDVAEGAWEEGEDDGED